MKILQRPKLVSFTGVNWNQKIEHPNAIEYVNWSDGEDYFCKYTINKPAGIINDLEQCRYDLKWNERFDMALKFIKGSGKFLNEKIYGISGVGAAAVAFDIGGDRVLKISDENPFEFREYNPKFDIPLLSKVEHYDGIYGYIQAKAETDGVGLKDVLRVQRKMKREGFAPSVDFNIWRTEQVGRYNGKSYLLDSRCAVRQNNLLTRFTRWFDRSFNRVIIVHKVGDDISPPCHVNETPPPNLSPREAWKIIKKVLKSWK